MNRKQHKQQGAVLIVSMVFLLLLTMIGLATMRSATLQTRMANNVRGRMAAFQAAEAALRAGEHTVAAYTAKPAVIDASADAETAPGAVWPRNSVEWQNSAWWADHATICHGCGSPVESLASRPSYVIEYLGYVPDSPDIGSQYGKPEGRYFYRVTAHATGPARGSDVVLQSTVATRFQ